MNKNDLVGYLDRSTIIDLIEVTERQEQEYKEAEKAKKKNNKSAKKTVIKKNIDLNIDQRKKDVKKTDQRRRDGRTAISFYISRDLKDMINKMAIKENMTFTDTIEAIIQSYFCYVYDTKNLDNVDLNTNKKQTRINNLINNCNNFRDFKK